MLDEALETLEMNGWTCDEENCVCSADNPMCAYQEYHNDPDRIPDSDEEVGSDDETDAESDGESDQDMLSDEESDEDIMSDESGYGDEVGAQI